MKKLTLIIMDNNPICTSVLQWVNVLCAENAAYGMIHIQVINETHFADIAKTYSYSQAPAFFAEKTLLIENVSSQESIRVMFDEVLVGKYDSAMG